MREAEAVSEQSWRRVWRWVVGTRARRSALTLAVLAAMASPFVIDTYDIEGFDTIGDVPLTAKMRARVIAHWGEDTDIDNCEEAVKRAQSQELESLYDWRNLHDCIVERRALAQGYWPQRYSQPSLYIAVNAALMLATLMVTFFALTAAMAIVRRWWRWWW